MKKLFAGFCAALSALFLCAGWSGAAASGQVETDTSFTIPGGNVAQTSTFSLRTDGFDWSSVSIVITSVTIPARNFYDGTVSYDSVTVGGFGGLSSATATGVLTFVTTAAVQGAQVSIAGVNLAEGTQWHYDVAATSQSCVNLLQAVTTYTQLIPSTCSGSVMTLSAPTYGSFGNNFGFATSTPAIAVTSTLVSSSPLTGVSLGVLSGGLDNTIVTVNGQKFLANSAWYPMTSNAVTATNLATAINKSSTTTGVVATGAGTVVYTSGTVQNVTFTESTTNTSSMTLGGVISNGGANSVSVNGSTQSYAYLGTSINVPSHNMAQGLGVYVTTSAVPSMQVYYATATPVGTISKLLLNTTYYVGYVDANDITLSLTQTGTPVIFVSSYTGAPTDVFALNVPTIAGTPYVHFVVSNDNTNWANFTTSVFGQAFQPPGPFSQYFSTGAFTWSDLGHVDSSWIGLSVTAPTSGEINIQSKIAGSAP